MRTRLLPALLLALVPGVVSALGLGNLRLESALNEPLKARIELLSAKAEELNSLHVDLADEAAFRRADIPRENVLRQLRFSIKESETGPAYILISSADPIREPFLNFLLEVNWSKGRLYREYTVLLDPPDYVTGQGPKKVTPPTVTTVKKAVPEKMESREIKEEEPTVIYHPEYKPPATPATVPTTAPSTAGPVEYRGGDYGPVVGGDTLWSIARTVRPDTSISIQQMMLALMRANPDAFINNNINGLKRGYVLKVPELSDAQSLTKDDAFAQARLQNSMWEETRQALVATPPVRPEGVPAQPPAETTVAPVEKVEEKVEVKKEVAPVTPEGKPELRLVAPGEKGKTAGQGGAAEPGEEALTKELALATETLEALTQENKELKDKISESEAIIGDLNRLVTLKANELAALQQQLAKKTASKESAASVTAPPVTEAPQPPKQEAKAPAPAATGKPEQATTPLPAKQAPAAKPGKTGSESDILSTILNVISGLLDQVRKNILYIAGGLGIALLVFVIAYFINRWQHARAVSMPQTAFTDLSEEATVMAGSEDSTDISMPADSEAITILPGPGAETARVTAAPSARTTTATEGVVMDEADPLEEVNVFLAYEHFDQAEEFVKNALEKEPDNLAYHTKLLEVYYTANNKKAYEQAARVLHGKVQGKGDYWNMALAMWQVLSPNRALFAAPGAGEEAIEAPTVKAGGGIVNIAGDEEAAAGTGALDLDLDTTGGGASGDTLEFEKAEAEPDILDVTAAISTADNEVLDFTAAVDTESDAAQSVATADDDHGLDFSLELEEKAPAEDKSLDKSLDLLQPQDEITANPAINGDDQALEFSLDLDEHETGMEAGGGLDLEISLDAASTALELAEQEKDKQAEGLDLDISLGSGAELAQDVSHHGADLLDVTSAIDTGDEAAELSKAGSTLLDVTSALSLDDQEKEFSRKIEGEAGVDIMDMSMPGPAAGGDLLDVTSATDFDLESGQDLLDVTSAGSVPAPGKGDASMLDFELAPDKPASDDTPSQRLDFELESSPESAEEAFEMDMDATMQIPSKRSSLSDKSDAEEDHTVRVMRSSAGVQSDEDEITTQLDLAKAYIELGNADSAKTILGEVIAVGNAAQRQQAQELLGQIS